MSATASVFETMFGETLCKPDGTTVSSSGLDGHVVGVYFSAHWCPPCRLFTPQLAETYNQIRGAGGAFEIVFVSQDRDEGSYKSYASSMPWLSMEFGSSAGDALMAQFGVSGIPSLILLGPDGKVCSSDGRSLVSSDPKGLAFPWGLVDPADLAAGDPAAGLDSQRVMGIMLAVGAVEGDATVDLPAKIKALRTLNKMASNVIAHPLEPKYRSVKRANKTIAAKVLSVPHAEAVAAALGFVDNGEGLLELTPSEAGWLVLVDSQKYLERTLARLIKELPADATATATATTTTTTGAATGAFGLPTAGAAAAGAPVATPAAAPGAGFGMPGMAGMGGMAGMPGMAELMANPQLLQQAQQEMMANPQLLQQAQQMMAQNPDMVQQMMAAYQQAQQQQPPQ